MLKYSPALLIVALSACSNGQPQAATNDIAADNTHTSISVDLAGHDLPLVVEMGDAATLGVDTPSVTWNDQIGMLAIKAGDRFSILISEEPGGISRLRSSLDQDPLQTHVVTEEAEDRIIYRSSFPDDALVFVHFYRIIRSGGREFVLRDDPSGQFNEADITRMIGSVRTQRPA